MAIIKNIVFTISRQAGLFLKGAALGIANVIPGVSGGTIALITGIFERLIQALKSFNIQALKYLLKGDLRRFSAYTDLQFLIVLFSGAGVAVLSIARLFEFLFAVYPVYIWSFFLGLILASLYFVGKMVPRWNLAALLALLSGLLAAALITLMNPATENLNPIYLFFCGVAGICSMILPGLSGSYILVLMGNYELIVIEAINNLRLDILAPVALGAVFGLLSFAHLLSWLLKRFYGQTIAVLTGFIAGSLMILYPWKTALFLQNSDGDMVMKNGEAIITGYQWHLPDFGTGETWIAIFWILMGIASLIFTEKAALQKENN
jgi:putative membrane protein